ncbi:MAG: hypothetical protein A2Y63_06025 [Candidatus Riflebacteria bacterium RBG_13_59_9]|nr:MAG: hypothetical protein A2Y63_06025 [Candidatus Riflebacteria bacterium RBG_13_59_9]
MEVAQDLHPAEVNASEMEAAMINLVMNAAEASLPGGTVVIEAGNVQLAPEEAPEIYLPAPAQFVRLAIIDSGRGVHPQDRQRIFDPFFTTKKTHKGMGLPVASSIVGRERGMLRLEKSDELGTTFAVYLPCRSPSQSAATDSATEDPIDSSAV